MAGPIKTRDLIRKIKKLEYRIIKDYDTSSFTDQDFIDKAQSIIDAALTSTSVDDIVDTQMPTELLGVTLDWTAGGEANDSVVELNKGVVTEDFDGVANDVEIE